MPLIFLCLHTLPVTFWPSWEYISISVEQLFSSSKHTLSDSRSSMTAESASKTVVIKEWLRKGLGDGVEYLDDIQSHG
jgi:hypothetical protein